MLLLQVDMVRLAMKSNHQKDVESLLASSFTICDTGLTPLQHLYRQGLSCCAWIRVSGATPLPSTTVMKNRFKSMVRNVDWMSLKHKAELPSSIRAMGYVAPLMALNKSVTPTLAGLMWRHAPKL